VIYFTLLAPNTNMKRKTTTPTQEEQHQQTSHKKLAK
jgi:hypothetical protein